MDSADIERICGPCQDLRACWAILGVFQLLMLCVHRYVPYPFEPVRWIKELFFCTNVVAVPQNVVVDSDEDVVRVIMPVLTRQQLQRHRSARRRRWIVRRRQRL
jgi:hypothetical protein